MNLTLLSNIAMGLLVIGTIPSIYTAIKKRKQLEGFSLPGSIVILLGQMLYCIYFISLEDFMTAVLMLPMIIFWFYVSQYKLQKWRDQ